MDALVTRILGHLGEAEEAKTSPEFVQQMWPKSKQDDQKREEIGSNSSITSESEPKPKKASRKTGGGEDPFANSAVDYYVLPGADTPEALVRVDTKTAEESVVAGACLVKTALEDRRLTVMQPSLQRRGELARPEEDHAEEEALEPREADVDEVLEQQEDHADGEVLGPEEEDEEVRKPRGGHAEEVLEHVEEVLDEKTQVQTVGEPEGDHAWKANKLIEERRAEKAEEVPDSASALVRTDEGDVVARTVEECRRAAEDKRMKETEEEDRESRRRMIRECRRPALVRADEETEGRKKESSSSCSCSSTSESEPKSKKAPQTHSHVKMEGSRDKEWVSIVGYPKKYSNKYQINQKTVLANTYKSNQIGRDELKFALVTQGLERSKKVRFSKKPGDVSPCGFAIMHHTIRVVMSACVILTVIVCGQEFGAPSFHLDCGQRLCIRMIIDHAIFTTLLPLPGRVFVLYSCLESYPYAVCGTGEQSLCETCGPDAPNSNSFQAILGALVTRVGAGVRYVVERTETEKENRRLREGALVGAVTESWGEYRKLSRSEQRDVRNNSMHIVQRRVEHLLKYLISELEILEDFADSVDSVEQAVFEHKCVQTLPSAHKDAVVDEQVDFFWSLLREKLAHVLIKDALTINQHWKDSRENWNDAVKNTTPELLSDHKNRFNRIKMFEKAGAHDELKKVAKAKKKIGGRQKLIKIQVVDPVVKGKYGDLEQNIKLNMVPFERRTKIPNGLLENFVRYCWSCGFAALSVVNNAHDRVDNREYGHILHASCVYTHTVWIFAIILSIAYASADVTLTSQNHGNNTARSFPTYRSPLSST